MCRWLAYSGGRVLLEDLLFKPTHNLIDQSLSARARATPTNGDGFGVGWYSDGNRRPGLFRSIRPAWNDFNLRDLATHIESNLFMAHVRATSLAIVQETNCHPFRYGNWLFVHNGEIDQVEKMRRDLLMAVAPDLFGNISGTTDSELMFHLALTFGLEADPGRALARMVGLVESLGRDHGIPYPMYMTVAVTDGTTLYAARYASDGDAPSLFYSRGAEEVHRINPAISEHFGASARAVVSEPIGEYPDLWAKVPQASLLRVRAGEVEVRPFAPEA